MTEHSVDPSLRASGTIVGVRPKKRGPCLTVGSPIEFSDMKVEVTGSPLLGAHTDAVLAELGLRADKIATLPVVAARDGTPDASGRPRF